MNGTTELVLVDTNILAYAYDQTDLRKNTIASKLIGQCWNRQARYAISSQNLAEFFIVITKKVPHPLSVEEAEQIIADICHFSGWKVLYYTPSTVQTAIGLHKMNKKHFWDALLVATMQEAGVTKIYTENKVDFEGFRVVTVVNPLE